MNRIWTKQTALLVALFLVAMLAIAAAPDQAKAYNGDNNDYREHKRNKYNKHRDNGRHRGWDNKGYVVQPGYPSQRAYYPPPVYYPPPPPAVIVPQPYPNFNIVIPLGR